MPLFLIWKNPMIYEFSQTAPIRLNCKVFFHPNFYSKKISWFRHLIKIKMNKNKMYAIQLNPVHTTPSPKLHVHCHWEHGLHGLARTDLGLLSSCGNHGNGGETARLWNVLIENDYIAYMYFYTFLMNGFNDINVNDYRYKEEWFVWALKVAIIAKKNNFLAKVYQWEIRKERNEEEGRGALISCK